MNLHQDAAMIDTDDAHATAVAHGVLFSPDLWLAQLWQRLDRGSKRALRGVSRAMRDQVDGAVAVVESPAAGFTAKQLRRALVRLPGLTELALLGVSDDDRDLQPLRKTSLAGLMSLTIRTVSLHMGA
jgi:hypothetical protein